MTHRIRLCVAALVLLASALPLAQPASAREASGDQPSAADATTSQPSSAELTLVWPTVGRITQPYGCTGLRTNGRRNRCAHFHNGIDIANDRGTHVGSAADGTVEYVGWDPKDRSRNRAWVVIVDHGDRLRSWYAHLLPRQAPGAKAGDVVSQGQLIGFMGSTGKSTGNHLHFMLHSPNGFIDPGPYLHSDAPPRKQQPARREEPDPEPILEMTIGTLIV